MTIWELDFSARPCWDDLLQQRWELLLCTATGKVLLAQWAQRTEVTAAWVLDQLQMAIAEYGKPSGIRVFRKASFHLAQSACTHLDLALHLSLRTMAVQRWLLQRYKAVYPQIAGYRTPARMTQTRPVPVAFPPTLLPETWGFSAVPAQELETLTTLTIPYRDIPLWQEDWNDWLWLKIIPGVFLFHHDPEPLARWFLHHPPVALSYVESSSSGLVLETDTNERWILATFTHPTIKDAGQQFIQRLEITQGLHFLAIQADEASDLTAFWLLQTPVPL
jgi:hypothetical protein